MKQPLSNPYYQDLFENTSDLIHFVNLEGEIELVNPTWLKTLGFESHEVIGKLIVDYISDDDRERFNTYRNSCIQNHIFDNIEIAFKNKQGERVLVDGHLRAYYQEGKPVHTRGVFRDITRKRQKERENEEQLLKINHFLLNAPDAVVVINDEQLVVEWNLKAEKMFGFSRTEALNQPLSELIIPFPYRETHKRGMQHFLKTGEGPVLNRTIEVSAIDKSFHEFPISLSISNVKLDDKWFFIAFMEDISDLKKQQEELVRQKVELSEAKQEGEKNKEFINIASHELKTPLTSIKALTQLALRGIGKHPIEQTTEYLHKIDQSSEKLKKLILDLLDISKIQAGKLVVNKNLVDYHSFLENVIETTSVIYPSHQIIITCNEEVKIEMDTTRIEQVIFNLVSNAVKYSPHSNLVEACTKTGNGMLVTSIKDYGKGIEKPTQGKVFGKFFQIDELEKTDHSGFGMGLYICSEIIKQHQGSIWLENNEGQGTTFYFALPINQQP